MFLPIYVNTITDWFKGKSTLILWSKSYPKILFPTWENWSQLGQGASSLNGNIPCPADFPLDWLETLEGWVWFFVIMEIFYKLIQLVQLLGSTITLKARVWASYVKVDLRGKARNEPAVSVSALQPIPLLRMKAGGCLLTDWVPDNCNPSFKTFGNKCFERCRLKAYFQNI